MSGKTGNLVATLEKIQKQIQVYKKNYAIYEREFRADGVISKEEQKLLDSVRTKIEGLVGRAEEFRKRNKIATVDFADEEPIEVPVYTKEKFLGKSAVAHIGDLLDEHASSIVRFWINFDRGLSGFSERMQFASEQESKPNYEKVFVGVIVDELYGVALKQAIAKLGTFGGPAGKAIGVCKSIVTAYGKESARAAAAAGELAVADFIAHQRNLAADCEKRMLAAVKAEKIPLQKEFLKIAPAGAEGANATGASAAVLVELENALEAFEASIPTPAAFQERFTTLLADTPGLKGLVSQGGEQAGTLHFQLVVLHDAADRSWQVKSASKAWRLVTKSPSPGKLATSLQRSMKDQGRPLWQVELPKLIEIRVQSQGMLVDSTVGTGYIYFKKDPKSFQSRANTTPDQELAKEAWGLFRDQVLAVNDLVGS